LKKKWRGLSLRAHPDAKTGSASDPPLWKENCFSSLPERKIKGDVSAEGDCLCGKKRGGMAEKEGVRFPPERGRGRDEEKRGVGEGGRLPPTTGMGNLTRDWGGVK